MTCLSLQSQQTGDKADSCSGSCLLDGTNPSNNIATLCGCEKGSQQEELLRQSNHRPQKHSSGQHMVQVTTWAALVIQLWYVNVCKSSLHFRCFIYWTWDCQIVTGKVKRIMGHMAHRTHTVWLFQGWWQPPASFTEVGIKFNPLELSKTAIMGYAPQFITLFRAKSQLRTVAGATILALWVKFRSTLPMVHD